MNKVSVAEAIRMARDGQSLGGTAIDNLDGVQIKARDALLLSDYGIVVPEQNIYYDEADVVYDPEFDEVEWTRLPTKSTLEEQAEMVAEASKPPPISIDLELADNEVSEWASANYDKLKVLLNKLVIDLYQARTMLDKK